MTNKDLYKFLIMCLIGLYVGINIATFAIGTSDAHYANSECNEAPAKIQYLFPGFRLGCYMGTPWGK